MIFIRLSLIANFLLLFILSKIGMLSAKYVEGHIKTLEDWVFVTRFCFLSGKGRYEYHIEFERRYGEPQLLLYYDDKSQWPAAYKSGKTCPQKVSVLSPGDNQIVTLSARSPYNILSGCSLRSTKEEKEKDGKETTESRLQPPPIGSKDVSVGDNFTDFDKFLITSTYPSASTNMSLFLNNMSVITFNETDEFNTQRHSYVPVGIDVGFENDAENNTNYNEFAEELFSSPENGTLEKLRVKRGYFRFDKRSTYIVSCRSAGGFLTARERWWYIAIANCGSKNGIDVRYKFRMTNGVPGDFWHEHFSADEMYIPPILLVESLTYTIVLLMVFICAIELKTRHLFHCTYRLFAFSAFLQYFGVLFSGVAWAKYGVTGLGPHTTIGTLFQGGSEIVFLALLLLMAKGYTITRARLSTCTTVKLTMFINIYIVVYIGLFIYREEVFDPGEVLNLYESPAGLGLAGLRCGAWGAFLISTASTVRKFPEKARFYFPFGILGSVWILGGPILTFIGIAFFDPWVRESVMCGVFALLAIGGHMSFLWLTWPSRANASFPYHVRTNHVGVMSNEDDGADYPRHVYEPSAPAPSDHQSVIIPLSRRAENLLNGVYNQYLREKEYYNSTSTPCSHVSFPQPSTQQTCTQIRQTDQQFTQTDLGSRQPLEDTDSDQQASASTQSSHQVLQQGAKLDLTDSGHPSIDLPSSPKVSSSLEESSERSDAPKLLKRNPFLINGVQSPPNKIILEPLDPAVYRRDSRESRESITPAHLFAARK